jgi:hypothetical protein
MNQLVVIDDSLILSLTQDNSFAAQIPCLYNKKDVFKTGLSGCGACARKKQAQQRSEMSKIKICLAGLSVEKRALLKQKLNAEQVRIFYVDATGKTVQLTF